MIEFRDFTCYYKLKKGYGVALDNISLTVQDGEKVAVVGPSGSGKTTLLKCILGITQYTKGSLKIDGTEVDKYDKRKNELAYVSQEFVLYPKMTVYQNIAYPLRASGMPYEKADGLVVDIAKKLRLYRLLTRKPKQLSGGQQQAVAIARALVKKPSVVLFDEPLSNLDAVRRVRYRQIISDICDENESTVVYVTHDPEEAYLVADKIVILDEGEIKGVMSDEEYAKTLNTDESRVIDTALWSGEDEQVIDGDMFDGGDGDEQIPEDTALNGTDGNGSDEEI